MEAWKKLLQNHPLYGLDRAMADYLSPVLERQFGELFRRYRNLEDAGAAAAVEATVRLGAGLVGRSLTLQEELLGAPAADPALRQVRRALLDAAQGEWRDLCQLYGDVRAELRDLESMAAAQQAPLHSGDSAHAQRVRDILALEDVLAPTWRP